jgi:hypothetical protein
MKTIMATASSHRTVVTPACFAYMEAEIKLINEGGLRERMIRARVAHRASQNRVP